jgi:hypothetical protein
LKPKTLTLYRHDLPLYLLNNYSDQAIQLNFALRDDCAMKARPHKSLLRFRCSTLFHSFGFAFGRALTALILSFGLTYPHNSSHIDRRDQCLHQSLALVTRLELDVRYVIRGELMLKIFSIVSLLTLLLGSSCLIVTRAQKRVRDTDMWPPRSLRMFRLTLRASAHSF